MAGLKAYKVNEKDEQYSTIVFAKSAGEAKAIAQRCDCCEDATWIDIRVRRLPEADRLYKGYPEIDWYDSETRTMLVRDLGWSCMEPSWECDSCPAKPYCHWHEEDET